MRVRAPGIHLKSFYFLFSFEGTKSMPFNGIPGENVVFFAKFAPFEKFIKIPGDYGEGVPPVPIPNTAVKPLCADGTCRATGWESKSLPGVFFKKFLFLGRGTSCI